MRKNRNKLLITLVLTTLAVGALGVRAASAERLLVWEPTTETTTLQSPTATPLAGEPETPGNQSPPTTQNKYASGQSRSESISPAVPPYRIWWERIRMIWLARFPGATF